MYQLTLTTARENVHAEMYATLISTLINDPVEQHRLFNAVTTISSVAAKANWCLKWIENDTEPFSSRIIAFAAVEGIFFSTSFAAIFWLKQKGIMKGLCFSNELIARDEGLHTEFACLLSQHLKRRASAEIATQIVKEATDVEKLFIRGKSKYTLTDSN